MRRSGITNAFEICIEPSWGPKPSVGSPIRSSTRMYIIRLLVVTTHSFQFSLFEQLLRRPFMPWLFSSISRYYFEVCAAQISIEWDIWVTRARFAMRPTL